MLEKKHQTEFGAIHYWINKTQASSMPTLIFLPGLSADLPDEINRIINNFVEKISNPAP